MADTILCVHDLDLSLDDGKHVAIRGHRPPVNFGGRCVLWKILMELSKRYDNYCPATDLRSAVWGTYPTEEGTVWGAMSDLRSLLKPLGLTIKAVKGLGYRLEELPSA